VRDFTFCQWGPAEVTVRRRVNDEAVGLFNQAQGCAGVADLATV
jgi:hypothetical protein